MTHRMPNDDNRHVFLVLLSTEREKKKPTVFGIPSKEHEKNMQIARFFSVSAEAELRLGKKDIILFIVLIK